MNKASMFVLLWSTLTQLLEESVVVMCRFGGRRDANVI